MHITAQVSLYPTESVDADHVINQAIESSLANIDVDYVVGPVSTEVAGTPEDVWLALRNMYNEAVVRGGEVSMSITVSNGLR